MPTPEPVPVCVVCVPAGHPYVASSIATLGVVDDGLLVPPDVIPDNRPAGQWWPPLALDPDTLGDWLTEGHPSTGAPVDLVHVHFGFEGVPLADLATCTELLREHGVPLVLTVHDLRNPHLESDEEYAPRLDLLVRAADALVTLTEAAADEVERRWGRRPTVVPHPHVAPLDRIAPEEPGERHQPQGAPATPTHDGPLQVAVALKSLRANTLTAHQVEQLAAAVTATGADLEVGIHADALQPGFIRHDAELAALLRRFETGQGSTGPGRVTVRMHERLDDDDFLADLARPDAVVLPYRFGTHSGVLEACRDVSTVALVPSVGCYASQAPSITFDPDDIPGTVPDALSQLRSETGHRTHGLPGWAVHREGRAAEAQAVRRAHREVYAAALANRRSRAEEGRR